MRPSGSALEEVRDALVERLRDGDFEPKSFDSSISGVVRLTQVLEGMRRESESRLPAPQQERAQPPLLPVLSNEEARELALAVVRMRQAKIRSELATEKEQQRHVEQT